MHPRDQRPILYRTAIAVALASAGLFVLTLFNPQWIELLLGASPDGGDGSLERWILLGCTLVTAALAAALASREKRRLHAAPTLP